MKLCAYEVRDMHCAALLQLSLHAMCARDIDHLIRTNAFKNNINHHHK